MVDLFSGDNIFRLSFLATTMTRRSDYDSEFAYGAGQVNPRRAVHPGLVYDMDALNYTQFLCHEGYKESSLRIIVQSKSVNCSALSPARGIDAINYPSIQLSMQMERPKVGKF